MPHQTNLATSSSPWGGGFPVRYCPVSFHVPLLRDPQRNQIFEAIERVGLDQMAFELTERANGARLEHRSSGSRFVFHRDRTWRYVGYCSVSDGPETPFDRSWITLIRLVDVWLAELAWHLDTVDG